MADRLVICDTCAALGDTAKGADWAKTLRGVVKGVEVKTVSCLNICDRPVSLAVQGKGKPTYVFGDTDPDTDTDNLISLLELYQSAPKGDITDARSIGRLRHCLVAKIPAL